MGEQVLHGPHQLARVPRDAAERRYEQHRVPASLGSLAHLLHEQLVKPGVDAAEDDRVRAAGRAGASTSQRAGRGPARRERGTATAAAGAIGQGHGSEAGPGPR